jgi:uncharacterized protein (DUF697 family)
MAENWQTILLVGFFALCLLPIIIVAVIGFIVWRMGQGRLNDLLDPSLDRLQVHYANLKAANPSATDDQLIARIIHRQALRAGLVGAITGFGGFVTLPVALPVDIVLSLYIQAGMVNFIAQHYGRGPDDEWEKRLRSYLIVSGGGKVTQTTSRAVIGFLVRVIGKSLSKLVPVFSAVISFAVNYFIAQAIGRLALRWYSTRNAAPAQVALKDVT